MKLSETLSKINKNKKAGIIVKVIFFSILIFLFYKLTDNENKSLLQHKRFTTGIIESYYEGIKGADGFNYKYQVNGKLYKNFDPISQTIAGDINSKLHKSYPVIYDSLNPSISEMLVVPRDFKELNMPFPDSLKSR